MWCRFYRSYSKYIDTDYSVHTLSVGPSIIRPSRLEINTPLNRDGNFHFHVQVWRPRPQEYSVFRTQAESWALLDKADSKLELSHHGLSRFLMSTNRHVSPQTYGVQLSLRAETHGDFVLRRLKAIAWATPAL